MYTVVLQISVSAYTLTLHAYFMSDGSDSGEDKTPTDEHTTY